MPIEYKALQVGLVDEPEVQSRQQRRAEERANFKATQRFNRETQQRAAASQPRKRSTKSVMWKGNPDAIKNNKPGPDAGSGSPVVASPGGTDTLDVGQELH